ncbi:hypothetical protein JI435_418430 [Parastagonospora nodorum SN15]|uniref:Secreted protein n=1 Tax=Phaeosphaeria nodorum (strain SN15 / ATCC MYA-4574 / FGSC 10173) TaxID=321614 RepID=A0A7U2I7B4_PHANO|nr:hypothetical protein JI435_418430 [Parastagonospora nodorum SN15]
MMFSVFWRFSVACTCVSSRSWVVVRNSTKYRRWELSVQYGNASRQRCRPVLRCLL